MECEICHLKEMKDLGCPALPLDPERNERFGVHHSDPQTLKEMI